MSGWLGLSVQNSTRSAPSLGCHSPPSTIVRLSLKSLLCQSGQAVL